jgi:1-acyl-sn-glycerol-3-phosphate acyltransferase
MTALRRVLTVPTVIVLEVLILVFAPLLLVAAALVAAGTGSSRPVRSTALVVAYAGIELATLRRLLRREEHDWNAVLRDVLVRAYAAVQAILDVRLVLEEGSASREQLSTGNGLLVLARHCGPGDSLFIAWLLVVHYRLRLRAVLKSVLRLEPTLDMASDHLPLCFVGHRGRRARNRIHDLAAAMSPGEALLLFPEGANFSLPRWRRAVLALSASGAHGAARRARQRTYTLPPHRGGAAAALLGSPTADVLVLAHTGLAPDGRGRPWWRLPVHHQLIVRTVLAPAATVPRDRETLATWLDETWSQVDSWVHSHAVDQAIPGGGDGRWPTPAHTSTQWPT